MFLIKLFWRASESLTSLVEKQYVTNKYFVYTTAILEHMTTKRRTQLLNGCDK